MLLIGASGHAKVICSVLETLQIAVTGIFDDNAAVRYLNEYSVSGPYDENFRKEDNLIISIGDNRIRKIISSKVKHDFGTIIHPGAVVDRKVKIGDGTVLLHGCIVQRDAVIGNHCIINTNASVDHDCIIANYVHVSPGATLCGNVMVGEGTHIGAGATVIPNIKIGKWCIIGAGAAVVKDLPDYSVAVGTPARIIRTLDITQI
ncbi:acetyltransferase [Sediminibacterium ginsengisoli]|uniref:Sugar O-acyltransferase, sialic acid O-acetyltransferase NeuD family n=1 Tax=Sediminibacterium ginsengisoli TaxID=413434 RepID=A0A1T4N4K7_9BACT|nr:acetyltransferase [Sediminibacterium ginsengisoli]SJZ74021.1 sugar O-acyltransferase, sialic acid O-acetyltransferase NeuD family [Sediminibacterium ginsengisoli]